MTRKLASSYARSGLKLGLNEQLKIGANPFKFGMIGSTDSHTSLSMADDNIFWGQMSKNESRERRMLGPLIEISPGFSWGKAWEIGAAGYAAVWVEENSREFVCGDEAAGGLCEYGAADQLTIFRWLGLQRR